jgi:uncharacterized membrane protein
MNPATAPCGNDLEQLMAKNVKAVMTLEGAEHDKRSAGDRVADAISAFCGSMTFVWTHVIWFTLWLVWNEIPAAKPIDPFPFSLLTLAVSLEAIFLSTFILISENRQGRLADRRNLLDLQINLLAEQENTKQLALLRRIADKLGVAIEDQEIAALEAATDYERLTEQIEEHMVDQGSGSPVAMSPPKTSRT